MRYRIVVALSAVLLSLLAIPAVNILSTPASKVIDWKKKSFLYNIDFFSGWVAGLLYPLGISTAPQQVVVGREGWLFLGDKHNNTLTVDRRPLGPADLEAGRKINSAMQAWEAYFAGKGVKLFKIMIGPNKGTIYPEYLPGWARPASPNATDALFAEAQAQRYVDLKRPLLAAAMSHPETLYYKLDTHWNFIGGGVAFRAFAEESALAAPELQWPPAGAYEVNRTASRRGGDLTGLLRLPGGLEDAEPMIRAFDLPLETTQSDFITGKVIRRGGNAPVNLTGKSVLVKSEGALNDKKVLWLRDSFGTAISPLMAATFSETLQVPWSDKLLKADGPIADLMDSWKPDYVLVTVVERNSRGDGFFFYPPATPGASR